MTDTPQHTYTLTDDATGKSVKLPVVKGTMGPETVDVRKLYEEGGIFTLDPSFSATASCKSRITYIDGDKGVLLHRGYKIEELAEKSTFLEVAYLLLNGNLRVLNPKFGDFLIAVLTVSVKQIQGRAQTVIESAGTALRCKTQF